MELGNMIFGNSRGEFEIPRTPAFEGPWEELCETLNLSWRGYPEEGCRVPGDWAVENDVFRVMPYDWGAECDCGADEKMEAWHEAHSHTDDCYQSELRRRRAATGFWDEEAGWWKPDCYDAHRAAEDRIYADLCRERDKPRVGCAVHCDCGRDELADKAWSEIGGHKDDCRLIQPNFLFKPTGLRINWYKYPFRDSYMSQSIKPKEWREVVRACIASTA